MQPDEIYLLDLWRMFAREWKWFAGVLLCVLAVTFVSTHWMRRQWEATAWIRLGQIGQVPAGRDPLIEPLARILGHLKMVPFQDEILVSAGVAPHSPAAGLFRKSLELDPMPYAGPLIRLRVRAYSQPEARRLAIATVDELRGVQRSLAALPLELARARLREVQAELRGTRADRDRLLTAVGADGGLAAGGRGARDALLASVLVSSKNAEIRSLQQAQADLVERLSPAYTFPTSLAWPVYVPAHPAFPNPVLIWAIGALFGLCLAAFAVVARNAVRRLAAGASAESQAREAADGPRQVATVQWSADDVQP